ncbi:UvrD-helicase domain-containing protein [Ramlibacter rhizophilus]|uniref:DNA 3'-5' helicase n=1 Tax=Ramlibacter rhizophilus TaxID=1781167 RepID=A0A4Z0BEV2_9BURK|nr:UvrD-helicase domain-containing protein [Ramlibacter rhizophilus]TFY96909.1 DNA helicase II [Ramlibacter rhizophilus]
MSPQFPTRAPADPASSPLLGQLNDEQRAAVSLPPEHALILAGAGSGKTRVLTTRIAWLLSTGQVSPGGVMAVTFTNKAAKEMMTRLSAMLPVNVRGMWIGTFHGLCNRFLRAHYKLAELPQAFQILDTQDQLSAIKRLMKQHNVDEERFPAKELQWFIGGCKEEGMRPRDVPARSEDDRRKVEIYQLYEDQCQREGVVDFGELMLRSYELMRDNDPVREHYRRRFRHILIDEFQDTNRLQYLWIKTFAGDGNAVFAVGDDDQSIYAFRGARVGNMADFVREFGVSHQIKLEQNYRSYSNILDSANALIAHNKGRLGKNLRTTQGPGEPVRVYEAPTDLAEAQWAVEEIRHLVGSGLPRHEIAILYRSNAQSRVIETGLFNAGLPYRVYGGLRFFERAEIKHALAYLRLLENPRDDTSFLRVVNFPPRGIGARSIEQLQDAARAAGCSLHDAVSATTGKAGANLGGFVAKIDVLREQTQGLTLREIIEQVLAHSGLLEHYRAERDGADRIENLEELVNAAESFVTQEGFGRDAVALPVDELGQSPASQGIDPDQPLLDEPIASLAPDAETGETLSPLAAFLTHAALEAGDNQAQAGQDAVQLMTVHAAKGLEFDAVFVTGLEEGLFPSERSMSDLDGLEEERRLMYVAITRARQRLYLSHSQTRLLHGQTRYNVRSRFFDELPEHALKWLTPRGGAGQARSAFGWGSGYPSTRLGGSREAVPTVFANPPVPPQKAPPAHGLRPGMKVFHTKFGEGKVQLLEGQGDEARAQINFPRHGVKWLALSVAKLTPVE